MTKRVLLSLGLFISAFVVFYSGLMFLRVVPGTLSIRFWDGGQPATNAAAVLDIACGAVLLYLVANVLLGLDIRRHARNALLVCIAAVVSDWIGGLYGIGALIGLVCCYFLIRESGSRPL